MTTWKHLQEELRALLFYGISRKGWSSESESRVSVRAGSPGLAVLNRLAPCSDGSAAVWGRSREGSVPVSSWRSCSLILP